MHKKTYNNILMSEKIPGKLNISADLKEKLSNLCMSRVVKNENSNSKTLVSTVNPSVKHSPPNQNKNIPPPPPPPPISIKKEITPPPSPIISKNEEDIQEDEDNIQKIEPKIINEQNELRVRNVVQNKSILDQKLEELGVKIIEREINNLNKETRVIFVLGMITVILLFNLLFLIFS